jgi:hypothetical protein
MMRRSVRLFSVFLLGACSWDGEPPKAPVNATSVAPASPPAIPAAPPPAAIPPSAAAAVAGTVPPAIPGPTPYAPAPPVTLRCDQIVPKVMLDAITGLTTDVSSADEPSAPGALALRCEHRASQIDEHFGYFVECGKSARKRYAHLRKRMRKLSRNRRGAWTSAFEAPASFVFLSRTKRCYGQVAGRLLLRRPDLGERIAAEMDRNLVF